MNTASQNDAAVATAKRDTRLSEVNYFESQALPISARSIHSKWNGIDVRLIFILAAVMAMTLLAACSGCLICCCRQKRTRKRRLELFTKRARQAKVAVDGPVNNTVEVTGCSEFDESAIRYMNTIMALHAFDGRELEVYKRERQRKHCGRMTTRSSQYCPLPASIQSLQGQTLLQVARPLPVNVPDQLQPGEISGSRLVKEERLPSTAEHDQYRISCVQQNKPLENGSIPAAILKTEQPAEETASDASSALHDMEVNENSTR